MHKLDYPKGPPRLIMTFGLLSLLVYYLLTGK